ncbi:MAG: homocysteine S-methyltransferase [Candidatus Competibacter sp.]|nr:homocysteine S-methyltransferase [Candidatus Competibacter sp.]MDG4583187.1 homocysteine S-methyltransferase [Candidatus Competibacter sp.]
MNPIASILRDYPLIVLDGALATELEQRGRDLRDPLWSAKVLLEEPDLIRQVHRDYFLAGADGVITASYQASIEGFARRGIPQAEALALIRRSVDLAREARDAFWSEPAHRIGRPRPFVAASVGPYGAFLADGSEYRGDYGLGEAELIDFHRPRLAALLAAGPDILACETLPCLLEAQALVRLLAEFPEANAWISFSARDDTHTCHGERLADCAAALDDCAQIVAIGVNCTAPRHIPALIDAIRAATDKPIVVYPNSGEIYDSAHRCWEGESSVATFAEQAREWAAHGARIIGGCCRTSPEHIRALAAWVRASR